MQGGEAIAGSELCAFAGCGLLGVRISPPWHWREQSGETHVVFTEAEHAHWALHWIKGGVLQMGNCVFFTH